MSWRKDSDDPPRDALLADSDIGLNHAFISTRNIAVNRIVSGRSDGACRWDGWPVAGDPAPGKSLLLSQVLTECQARGGISVLQDTERAYDRTFMKKVGLTDPTHHFRSGHCRRRFRE